MKLTKRKLVIIILVLLALVFTYFWGGNYAGKNKSEKEKVQIGEVQEKKEEKESKENKKEEKQKIKSENKQKDEKTEGANNNSQKENKDLKQEEDKSESKKNTQEDKKEQKEINEKEKIKDINKKETDEKTSKIENKTNKKQDINPKTRKDKYMTDPVPEGKPLPVEWQDVTIDTSKELYCTLSVRCDTILDNMDIFNKDKLEVLPKDGTIFAKQKVLFYKGESVFNVLQREMKKNNIHMEFVMTPVYNSVYIEGINNLYEFDTGELSGWMYKVNGWFPNYGASRYQIQEGDIIEWVYTCDLGRDVGGFNILDSEIPEDKKKILEDREKEKQNNN